MDILEFQTVINHLIWTLIEHFNMCDNFEKDIHSGKEGVFFLGTWQITLDNHRKYDVEQLIQIVSYV